MSDPNDRNLLLGVLAVRMGFIDRPALTAAKTRRSTKRTQLAEEYPSAALDALSQCREAGFFADARRVEQFKRDAAFDGLREREEFKKVVEQK